MNFLKAFFFLLVVIKSSSAASSQSNDVVKAATEVFNNFAKAGIETVNAIISGSDPSAAIKSLRESFIGVRNFFSSLLDKITKPVDGVDVRGFLVAVNEILAQAITASESVSKASAQNSAQPNGSDCSRHVEMVFRNIARSATNFFAAVVKSNYVNRALQKFIKGMQRLHSLLASVASNLKAPVNGINAKDFLNAMNSFLAQIITAAQKALSSA